MTVIRKEVGSNNIKYVKYTESKPGEVIASGIFEGSVKVPGFQNRGPDVLQHSVLSDEGVSLKLRHSGQLDYKLSAIPAGAYIEVTFLGKEKVNIKGALTDVNQFKVEILTEESENDGEI